MNPSSSSLISSERGRREDELRLDDAEARACESAAERFEGEAIFERLLADGI